MEHSRYTISQVSEMLGVRDSVLRYWEDELQLRVHRNGQGHRYYTRSDILLLQNIMEWKKKGMQLRAIRQMLPNGNNNKEDNKEEIESLDTQDVDEKEDKILKLHEILHRLMKEAKIPPVQRGGGEERYRSFDETLRKYQQARKEAALTSEIRKER